MPPTLPVDSGSLVNTSITIHFCQLHGNPVALVSRCMCSVNMFCAFGFYFADSLPSSSGNPTKSCCSWVAQFVNYSYPSTFPHLASTSPGVYTSQHFNSHAGFIVVWRKVRLGADATTMRKFHQTLIQPRFWNATVNLVMAEENNAGWCVSVSLCALWPKEMQKKNEKTQIHAQSSTSIVQNVLVPGHAFQLGNLETNQESKESRNPVCCCSRGSTFQMASNYIIQLPT